jgi:glycosyltransferase involved in cell wall biosynthesis
MPDTQVAPELHAPATGRRGLVVLCVTLTSDRAEIATFAGLKRAGCDLTVFCLPECPYVAPLEAAGIRVERLPIRRRHDREAVSRLRAELSSRDYDIVHLLHNRAVSNGLRALRGFPRPKVVCYRGIVGNVSPFNPMSWRRYLNPRVDRVVCVADAIRRYFVDMRVLGWRLPADKFVTIYKGHDLAWYCERPADLTVFGVPKDAFVVGCVANMRPRKGIEMLVAAFGRLPADAGVHLLLVGHMRGARLDAEIAANPNRARIHRLGHQKNAPALIAACDVSVLPTLRREGLPKTVIEAMAYGVPVVVTDAGGSPELVVDGDSGLVVPAGDAAALAAALMRLRGDRALRERLGRSGRQRIADRFDIRTTVAETLALYRELTDGRAH